jgi:hypothetical protein
MYVFRAILTRAFLRCSERRQARYKRVAEVALRLAGR